MLPSFIKRILGERSGLLLSRALFPDDDKLSPILMKK